MALQPSGRITSNEIRTEFKSPIPMRMSQHYRGGQYVGNSPKNQSISTSGRIAHSMFYGASNELTAEEVVRAAWDGRLAFSRWMNDNLNGYNPNPFPDGVYVNNAWGRNTYQHNLSWDFFNDGWASIDDWCTVAIVQGQEYSYKNAPSTILSVTHINGNALGATFAGSFVSGSAPVQRSSDPSIVDNNLCLGGNVAIYHINADRRDIRKITTAIYGPSMNSVRTASLHIFPSRLTIVAAKGAVADGSHYVELGDIIVWGQRSYRSWEYGIAGANSIVGGREWYAYATQGVVFGLDSRYFSHSYGYNLGLFANVYDGRTARNNIVLRKLTTGQSATTFDRCVSNLIPYQSRTILKNSNGGNGLMYTNTVTSSRVQDARGLNLTERLTYVGHTVNSNTSGFGIICRVEEGVVLIYADVPGGSYPMPNDQPTTYNYSVTVTVTTISGRSITSTVNGTGTLHSYYESTGGD